MSENFLDSPLFKSVLKRAYKHKIPLMVLLELTNRCNEKCLHCYIDQTERNEMEVEKWIHVLDSLANMDTLILTLTGGEPLLRKDFIEIYKHAYSRKFAIRLFTNGTLLNKKMLDILAQHKPLDVQISLYGHTAEIHDQITQVPGSFNRTVKTINDVVDIDIPVFTKASWMNQNADYYQEICDYATDLGTIFRGNISIVPRRKNGGELQRNRMSAKQTLQILEWGIDISDSVEPPQLDSNYSKSHLCGAGIVTMRIGADGSVYPCTQILESSGNINDKPLEDIWKQSSIFNNLRKLRKCDASACQSCVMLLNCFRCPGRSLQEEGSLLSCYTEAKVLSKARTMIRKRRSNEKY